MSGQVEHIHAAFLGPRRNALSGVSSAGLVIVLDKADSLGYQMFQRLPALAGSRGVCRREGWCVSSSAAMKVTRSTTGPRGACRSIPPRLREWAAAAPVLRPRSVCRLVMHASLRTRQLTSARQGIQDGRCSCDAPSRTFSWAVCCVGSRYTQSPTSTEATHK